MAIRGYDDRYFYPQLHEYVRPARATIDPKRLYGRETKLKDTRRALSTPGRQVFIFGERGVGKTSLAKTAVKLETPDIQDPILVGCERNSTFVSIINGLIKNLLPYCIKKPDQRELSGGFNLLGISIGTKITWNADTLRTISDPFIPLAHV